MRREAIGFTVLLASAASFFPGRARACEPWSPEQQIVDPTQVGVDQTPPQLAQPTVAELLSNEDSNGTGCQPKCGSDHSATHPT
jgi:hypothetical protein